MKYTPLLSICSVLFFTSQTFAQESVNAGMGGTDFGNVEVDVPEEEQQGDEHNGGSVVPNAQDPSSDQGEPDGSTVTPTVVSFGTLKYSESVIWSVLVGQRLNSNTPDESTVDGGDNDCSVPGYKKKIVTVPKRYRIVSKGGSPNDDRSYTPRGNKRCGTDNAVYYPTSYACDCCCHLSKDSFFELTEDSDSWNPPNDSEDGHCDGQDDKPNQCDRDRNTVQEDRKGDGYQDEKCSNPPNPNANSKDDDSKGSGRIHRHDDTCDKQGEGHQVGRSHIDDDDCECTCRCKKLAEVLVYD